MATLQIHDWLRGMFDPSKTDSFELIPESFSASSGAYLHRDALKAYMQLAEAASKAGIQLKSVSAFRSFERQKEIWEAKWTGKVLCEGRNLAVEEMDLQKRALHILRYSAMPGTSRHHWGSDLDLNSVEPEYFESGEGLAIFQWLSGNARKFGFARPYTPKGAARPEGYEEEKWHWSFLPLAIPLLREYNARIGYARISGFMGCQTAEPISVIDRYVNGVHSDCQA